MQLIGISSCLALSRFSDSLARCSVASDFEFDMEFTCPTSAAYPLSLPRIRAFDCKARFPNLRRVCRSDTRELRSPVLDNVKVAVGGIVFVQPKILADCLGGLGGHLNKHGGS